MAEEEPKRPTELTRRAVLGGAVTLVCAPPLLSFAGCGPAKPQGTGDGGAQLVDGWEVPPGTKLTPARYALLSAVFDALIPKGPNWPGAADAHAAWYLDQLLGAFDVDPPRIYAGGPYSGRHGGVDGFSQFQRLTRVEEISWRTYLEGSKGLPEREFNGPVKGLDDRLGVWLDALDANARKSGSAYSALGLEKRRRALLDLADTDFLQVVYEHCCEGAYGDPVYGGNFQRRGWDAVRYEGDRQPLGYTERQMSHPEEG